MQQKPSEEKVGRNKKLNLSRHFIKIDNFQKRECERLFQYGIKYFTSGVSLIIKTKIFALIIYSLSGINVSIQYNILKLINNVADE